MPPWIRQYFKPFIYEFCNTCNPPAGQRGRVPLSPIFFSFMQFGEKMTKTRMHSRRMHTGRSLTIFGGGCTWSGGVPGLGGCTWSWGVYLVLWGVPGLGGVPGLWGVYLVLGGVPALGGCTWSWGVYMVLGDVPALGGCLLLGGCTSS